MNIKRHIVCVLAMTILLVSPAVRAQDTIANALIHSIYSTHMGRDINQLLRLYQDRYGVQSKEYADCVLWCSMQVAETGDIPEAKRVLAHSERLFQKYGTGPFDGRDSTEQILYWDTKAIIERVLGREYMQVRYTEKAVALKKQVFGFESDVYLNSLLDLAELYSERFRNRKSQKTHNEGYETYVNLIKREFARLPESQRQAYWNSVSGYIEKTVKMAHNAAKRNKFARQESLAGAAYNAILLSKSLLLNTTMAFETYVRESGVEEAIALLNQRKTAAENDAQTAVLDSLDYAILNALAAHDKPYRVNNLDITWRDVQAQLNDDDLAIEFYRIHTGEYGALALRKSWSAPQIVPLKEMIRLDHQSYSIDKLISLGIFNHELNEMLPQTASKVIWPDELVKHFPRKDKGAVYFAADGQMLVTAIEHLPIPKTEYTMSDVYHLHRLSSTRELALNKQPIPHTTATLYGGITYSELADSVMRRNSEHFKYAGKRGDIKIVNEVAKLAARYKHKYIWSPLKWTKIEVEGIAPILDSNRIEVTVYMNDTANEESVKALNGKKQNVLHFATHGFFWSKEEAGVDNPLERSGLVFAGVDKVWKRGYARMLKDVEEGMLLSKEIASLDLRETDIVVLSACETGLGDVTGDGVFGLQRAFKMAGVQTILMSLWAVNDTSTSILMTAFYRNYYINHQTKSEAFRNAQQEVRSSGYKKPEYWAGFVLLD